MYNNNNDRALFPYYLPVPLLLVLLCWWWWRLSWKVEKRANRSKLKEITNRERAVNEVKRFFVPFPFSTCALLKSTIQRHCTHSNNRSSRKNTEYMKQLYYYVNVCASVACRKLSFHCCSLCQSHFIFSFVEDKPLCGKWHRRRLQQKCCFCCCCVFFWQSSVLWKLHKMSNKKSLETYSMSFPSKW